MQLFANVISEDYPDFTCKGAPDCSTTDPEIFFPNVGSGGTISTIAKRICRQCPYVVECLEYALSHPEEQGIWGGTTSRERMRMRGGNSRRLHLVE